MPALAILFWLILLAGFVGCWLVCLVGWLIGRKKKIRWLKWVGGVPLVALTGLGLLAAGAILWGIYCSNSPPHVFEASFGFAANKNTSFKSGYWSVFFDSGVAELSFKTDPNTIDQVIKTGFVEMTQEEYLKDQYANTNSAPTRFFKKSPFKGFSSDVAFLTVNESTGEVYFHWSGID